MANYYIDVYSAGFSLGVGDYLLIGGAGDIGGSGLTAATSSTTNNEGMISSAAGANGAAGGMAVHLGEPGEAGHASSIGVTLVGAMMTNAATVKGGAGGAGGVGGVGYNTITGGGGGYGGAGGAGYFGAAAILLETGAATLVNGGTITGGQGGASGAGGYGAEGGSAAPAKGGAAAAGGAGGAGVAISAGSVTNGATIYGGAGGAGGAGGKGQNVVAGGSAYGGGGGNGGAGGVGVWLDVGGVTTSNTGLVTGGGGGAGGAGGFAAEDYKVSGDLRGFKAFSGIGGVGGKGGYGLKVSAGDATNSGSISGGGGGDGGVNGEITGGYIYEGNGGAGGAGGAGVDVVGGYLFNSGAITGGPGGIGGGAEAEAVLLTHYPNTKSELGSGGAGGAGGAGVFISAGELVNDNDITGGPGTSGGAGAGAHGLAGAGGAGVYIGGSGTVQLVNKASAAIGGATGVMASADSQATVTNYGLIDGNLGTSVDFNSAADELIVEDNGDFVGAVVGGGGTLVLSLLGDFGTISGLGGVATLSGEASATFSGFGSYVVSAGASAFLAGSDTLAAGKTLTNDGFLDDIGSMTNLGTIEGPDGLIMGLVAGGVAVTNGSEAVTTALIAGNVVEYEGVGALINYGTIGHGVEANGAALALTNHGVIDYTVNVGGGSMVTNDTGDLISDGPLGVNTFAAASVVNAGTIEASSVGVSLASGSTIANETGGLVSSGGIGVYGHGGPVTVDNSGMIEGAGGAGVYGHDGPVTVDNSGMIEGLNAGLNLADASVVDNLGTILATGAYKVDIRLKGGGSFTNGAPGNDAALIKDYNDVYAGQNGGAATITNYGSIEGVAGEPDGVGVWLVDGGSVVNGPGGDASALVENGCGVYGPAAVAVTVTNFGTLDGTVASVQFKSSSDRLIAESGSTFVGAVEGGGGTLELANGTGTIIGLGGGGTLSVAEAMTFSGFGAYAIDKGASWTLTNANTLAAGQSLTIEGAVTLAGSLTGAGSLSLVNGTAAFDAGSDPAVGKVTESGNASSGDFSTSNLVYAGLWVQNAGTLSAGAGDRVNFTGAGDTFSGFINGAGTVAFLGGSDTLSATHISIDNPVINGATVTLSGAIGLSSTMGVTAKDLIIAGGGASLAGDGALVLTNLATNTVSGGMLTNVNDYIKGAGQLGDGAMVLVNDKGGIIDGDDTVALTINTGSSTISNAGRIEAASAATTVVESAVDNTGVLVASGGTLTVEGAVTGTGKVEIDGGLADLASTFNQNVAFLGAGGGTLELAHSEAYTGEISGFSRTGATALDLADIPFVSGTTKASYSGTATSGVLTVVDGSNTAAITLEGNFARSTFTLSSDGHGGTTVVDPAKGPALAPASGDVIAHAAHHRLIAAMAGFGASGGGGHAVADGWRQGVQPTLATPRMTQSA